MVNQSHLIWSDVDSSFLLLASRGRRALPSQLLMENLCAQRSEAWYFLPLFSGQTSAEVLLHVELQMADQERVPLTVSARTPDVPSLAVVWQS